MIRGECYRRGIYATLCCAKLFYRHSGWPHRRPATDGQNVGITVSGRTVLITGAAMGMGLLYAERAVREGAKAVILWEIGRAHV